MDLLLNLLAYTIPAVVVLIATVWITKLTQKSDLERQKLQQFAQHYQEALPLRLQAYERIILFLERISPPKLVTRVYPGDANVRTYRQLLIENIRDEYDYNLSQQLYVSSETWRIVTVAKEEMIRSVHEKATQLNPAEPGLLLVKALIEQFTDSEAEVPLDTAIEAVKKEARQILKYGG